jgi:hypothetical protein
MLRFEREVVRSLVTSPDDRLRSAVEDYVDGCLRTMPEYLRAGMTAETMVLGAWAGLLGRRGGADPEGLVRLLDRWEDSRIGPVNQYVRLLRSLVLFAECEMAPAPEPASA